MLLHKCGHKKSTNQNDTILISISENLQKQYRNDNIFGKNVSEEMIVEKTVRYMEILKKGENKL